MQIHVLEYLERSSALCPDKVVYQDEQTALTFFTGKAEGKTDWEFFMLPHRKEPAHCHFFRKSVETPLLYLGVLYSGCFMFP